MMSSKSAPQKGGRVKLEGREAINKDYKYDQEWQAALRTAVIILNSQHIVTHLQTRGGPILRYLGPKYHKIILKIIQLQAQNWNLSNQNPAAILHKKLLIINSSNQK